MEEAAHVALAVAGDSDDRVVLVRTSEPLERHREAAFVDARAPGRRDALELGHRLVGHVGERLHREGVPRFLDPGHRLAHLADRPALEREPRRLDDGLVTEVEAPQPERLERGGGSRADRHRPRAGAREPGRMRRCLVEQRRQRGARADGITGTEHHPALDAIAEERRAVVGEEVLLVAAELEERERVVAVPAHELLDRMPHLGVGERTRRRQRPEHEPGGGAEGNEPEQAERERQMPALVSQVQLARLPGEQLEGLVEPVREAGMWRSDRDGDDAEEDRRQGDRRHPPGGGPEPHRIAPHVERIPAPPEQCGTRGGERRLLDIEALDDVEDREAAEEASATCHATRGGGGGRTRRRAARPRRAPPTRERGA